MVVTESMNYHVNYIGAIRTHKEHFKTLHKVLIDITKRRFGEYQEVDIIGSTKDIRECKQSLQFVVKQAEIDYHDYSLRKRKRQTIKSKKSFKFPELVETKKKVNANPFASLEGLEELEAQSVKEISYENNFPVISKYDPNVSWGDISEDEE